MKIEDIFEAPQNTFPTEFGLDETVTNIRFGKSLLSQRKTAISKVDEDYTLWEFEREYALIRDSDSYVAYYMKFRFDMIRLIKRMCVRQVIVWKSKEALPDAAITKKIFNDLIHKYQTVITDAEQTPDGRRFWLNRISDALSDSSLFVYYINIIHPTEVVAINSMQEYTKVIQTKPAYGDKTNFQTRRFIITSKPFDK